MAAWPLNIYELSRPPLRRERAINWESRGGGTERERKGERERSRRQGSSGRGRGCWQQKGTKNEIPPAMERNRLWLLSSHGISLSMFPTGGYYPPGYNCTPQLYTSLPWQKKRKKYLLSVGGWNRPLPFPQSTVITITTIRMELTMYRS